MNIGLPEILLIAFVVLVLFGAKRIPELARAIGRASVEYRKAKSALATEGNDRPIGSSTVATIHVSKISPDYTDNVADEFRKGDLVRGKVISVKPSLQLTTKEPHLGVVRAQCGICKTELVPKGKKNLFCPKCKRSQPRKLADDYGDVVI